VADGGTPATPALRATMRDFPVGTTGTIVLVADGNDDCGDLCMTAREIRAGGFDLTIQAIGVEVAGSAAERALRCAAQETGGQYFGFEDLAEFPAALAVAVDPNRYAYTSTYGSEEAGFVIWAAAIWGLTPETMQKNGVGALLYFAALSGRSTNPVADPPSQHGDTTITTVWTTEEKRNLDYVTNHYRLTPEEAQKLGASLLTWFAFIS